MQMNYLGTGEIFVMVWFSVAVIIEIISSIVLWFWLRRHGVKFVFGLAGIPGYMERAYLAWCRSQGHPCTRVLVLRAVSIINVIVAAIFFIAIATR
jgi:type IV secretory pathway TraG/TraD family ATPase VirD4